MLALLLLASSLAPVALAHGQEAAPDDPAADWRGVKAHLADGNVSQAWAAWNASFAGAAAHHPTVEGFAEAAFQDAMDASPDTPAYASASQRADKAHYALAYRQAEDAVAAGNATDARAWVDLLHAKFGGDVADAHAAFANASTDAELEDALATLDHEMRDVILSKVHHETDETAELVEAGTLVEASAEGGEALGYYMSIQPWANATLGASDEATLRTELNELLAFAEAGNAEGAAEEADEILELVAELALATVPREKADAWSTVVTHLDAGELSEARSLYEDEFAHEGEEYASAAHQRVLDAFANATQAQADDRSADLTVHLQLVDKGILEVAWGVARVELAEAAEDAEPGALEEGLEYAAPVLAKFGWFDEPGEAAHALGRMAASNEVSDADLNALESATAAKLLDKVREEVEEVFIHWDDRPKAREKAIEGVAYLRPALFHVEEVLGDAPADELLEETQALYDATTAGDRDAADEAAGEVRTLLDQVAASGEEVTELDALLNDLEGKISFVLEETAGYHEALEAGDQDEADVELGETRAFAKGSLAKARANADLLRDGDADATDDLLASLVDLRSAVNASSPALEDVRPHVNASLEALDAIALGAQPGVVTVVLGTPTAGEAAGTLGIPVRLTGIPGDSVAFQATVTYDPAVISVSEVQVDAPVGASQTSDGEVRFNAASTQVEDGTLRVATLVVEVLDTGASVTDVTVTVEELTDGAGDPLGVEAVEGTSVDLASASTDDVPAPGALAVLLATVSAALAVGRTRGRHR